MANGPGGDIAHDPERLTSFKRAQRRQAARGAKEAEVALANAKRRDEERQAAFRARVARTVAAWRSGDMASDNAMGEIEMAVGEVSR